MLKNIRTKLRKSGRLLPTLQSDDEGSLDMCTKHLRLIFAPGFLMKQSMVPLLEIQQGKRKLELSQMGYTAGKKF